MLAGSASAAWTGVAVAAGCNTGSPGSNSISVTGMITDGDGGGPPTGWLGIGDTGISIDCERPTPTGCGNSAAASSAGLGIMNFAPHCGQTPRFPAKYSL